MKFPELPSFPISPEEGNVNPDRQRIVTVDRAMLAALLAVGINLHFVEDTEPEKSPVSEVQLMSISPAQEMAEVELENNEFVFKLFLLRYANLFFELEPMGHYRGGFFLNNRRYDVQIMRTSDEVWVYEIKGPDIEQTGKVDFDYLQEHFAPDTDQFNIEGHEEI